MKHRKTDEERLQIQRDQRAKFLGQSTTATTKKKTNKKTTASEKAIGDIENGSKS